MALLIIWYRAPMRMAHGFLWAEDAAVFMAQAHQFGVRSIITSYAGYLHLIPRVIAWVQMKISSVQTAPHFFVLCCAVIVCLSSACIAKTLDNIRPGAAIAVALAPVLSPQNGEVLLTITNLQWMLFPLLIVLLWECVFQPPEKGYAWRTALVAVLTLTGPFGVLAWPFLAAAVVHALRQRRLSSRQVTLLVVYSLAVAVQVFVMIRFPGEQHPSGKIAWASRAYKELFLDYLPSQAPILLGAVFAILLALVVCLSRGALALVSIVIMGVAIWALGAVRINMYVANFVWYGDGSRYLYVPLLFFMWCAIVSAETARFRWAAVTSVFLACAMLLASVSKFEVAEFPATVMQRTATGYDMDVAPGWHVHVDSAR
ncbi:hypothetical protein [Paraburkholderia sp. BCC1884]|uniref:hypothetical protein n=1 Tax=Paraburkholderia sp. BCC1884 TaxID=2562668 RepID=UPI0011826720|nr:hypothetical protein [Paraburkholderia sp. BCC1884]